MDLYAKVFRSVLLPAWEGRVRKRPTLLYLDYLEKTEWRSREELDALQRGALARLLAHAYNHVPFYRERFDRAGLKPVDVRTPAELTKLPLLTRDEAREAGNARASQQAPFSTIRKNTGGTTGQPLRFGYDLGSEHWRNAVKLRGYGWAGYSLGDKVLHFWGAPVETPPPLATRAKTALDRSVKREHYIYCGSLTPEAMDQAARFIRDEAPRAIVCYTQAGAELARYVNRGRLRAWPDTIVICGAEKLFPHDRVELERAFGPRVFETYGSREFMLIGSECEMHDGLHVSYENLIVEIVVRDGARERHARPGEVGEVVITDLHNFGMPFIRYKNGDMAAWADARRCPCGRNLPRLASVTGRASDMLFAKDGSRVNGIAFNVLFTGLAEQVKKFQVLQHKDRTVTLKVVPDTGYDKEVTERIARTCERYLGGLPVTVKAVEAIESTRAGKHRVVVVEE